MKIKKVLFLGLLLGFLYSPHLVSANCAAGGEGAKSCTFRTHASILGLKLWSVKGSSVSCGDGYYACCNAKTASCVENPSEPTIAS